MKLNDERKFFVNKNLFENQTLKLLAPPESTKKEPNKEESLQNSINTITLPSKSEGAPQTLIQQNPLSSTASIKLHQSFAKEEESPVVKSLFDFRGNSKKKPAEEKKEILPPKKFEFKNLFGEPSSKEKKLITQPLFGSIDNPFMPKGGFSNLFSGGKNLF